MGSGFALDMVSRLKHNQSLINKRNYSSLKEAYINTASKEKINYKKATKAEINLIRKKIILQKKSKQKRRILMFTLTLFLSVLTILALIFLFKEIFLT